MHNDPLIKLEDKEIPVINEYKYLGVIFDRKLSFISHMKYLKTNTIRAQQQRGDLTVKRSLSYTEHQSVPS